MQTIVHHITPDESIALSLVVDFACETAGIARFSREWERECERIYTWLRDSRATWPLQTRVEQP